MEHFERKIIMGRNKSLYNSGRWQKLRAAKLRVCPLCEYCPPDRRMPATQVDHRVAIADGGDPWAWENLASVCQRCHSQKTARGERLHGCGADGMPRDAGHWWNSGEKSLGADTGRPRVPANAELVFSLGGEDG